MSIWDFNSYREYLMNQLGKEGSRTGMRKKLAASIPVHTTFVSQVLKERADFSLEQAEAINSFLEHTEEEGEFFILLLLKDRAGSRALKKRFERKIKTMRDERNNIKKRLGSTNTEVNESDRERFYSSYIYGAIHVLSAIPRYKTVEALADALRLPRSKTQEVIDFLLRVDVLKLERGQLAPGSKHIHLSNENELILKHHCNWRMHTVSHLQFLNSEDLHYSACVSLSQEDAYRIKESILQNLKKNIDTISRSPEEVAYVMNLDFYKMST